MKNEKFEKILTSLGLTKSETVVYFLLLQKGFKSIPEISKESKLPRSTVVLSVETLVKEGLIRYYISGKRKNYLANEPKDILNLFSKLENDINLKKIEVNKIIPELESLYYVKPGQEAGVEKLNGEAGFRKAYEMTLNQKDGGEILRFGVSVNKFSFFNDYLEEYVQKKNKKNIKTKLLIPKDDKGLYLDVKKNDDKDLRETRFLDDKKYNPQGNVAIWENNVSFISWDKEFHITIIKDKNFADMMRMIFNSIWG